MPTTMYLWSAINRKPEKEMERAPDTDLDPRPGPARPKGRRAGKAANPQQKKIPQRGMGVAQLERLRLQERWKKMAETGEVPSPNELYPFPFSFPDQPQIPPPVSRPTPIRYTVLNGPVGAPDGATAAYGAGSMHSDHVSADHLRAAPLEPRFDNRNLVPAADSTRELSSIQKTHCFSASCEDCSKKKRLYAEDIGFQGNSRGLTEYNRSGCYFKDRKNIGNRRTVDREIVDFGEKRGRRACCFGAHVNTGGSQKTAIEPSVGFQKKGKFLGKHQPTEYDFFSSTGNSLNSASSAGQEAGGGEASSSASSFLDLTLKLSSY
ncbi:hypothetical protein H6P81_005712 [Aristolochia fimbriata]|uniref:Uncharacterized protein n=1 Tax=Aristolochia fimbriata TaxID=158543 RepID=A0AAV7EZS6_ARIFI|nr:hypothetical protein H6P81_005712 [Aristolochia fimbriata]